MRMALLEGASLAALEPEIMVLSIFSLTLLPLSLLIFSRTLKRARLLGTLSFY
jgi:hypothetical protein